MSLAVAVSISTSNACAQARPAAVGTVPTAPAVSKVQKGALEARLDSLLAAKATELGPGATLGVAIWSAHTHKLLYERNGREPLAVASNAKLVTMAASLAQLGPDFRFRTELVAQGADEKGRIPGNLVIRGNGDPSFGAQELAGLVASLKAAGVRQIQGGIVVDNSFFDAVNDPPHYNEQPEEEAAFRAPVAATSLTSNAWTLIVRGARRGTGSALVEVLPKNDHVVVTNRVQTVDKGRTRLSVESKADGAVLRVLVSGRIRQGAIRRVRRRVHDPVRFMGTALRRELEAQGISVRGKRVVSAKAPEDGEVQATHMSDPLGVAVRAMGKDSNNFVAEMLLKSLGAYASGASAPATWKAGQEEVRRFLTNVGLKPGSYRYDNGSGLFDAHRFSPVQLLQVLQYAHSQWQWGPDFFAALALSGADGTLSQRLVEDVYKRRVRAKTGTLDGVSALSGVATSKEHGLVFFSILINGFDPSLVGPARALQDDIVRTVVDGATASPAHVSAGL